MDLIESGAIFNFKPANISRLDVSGTTAVSRFEELFLASPRAKVRQFFWNYLAYSEELVHFKTFKDPKLKTTEEKSLKTYVFCVFECKMGKRCLLFCSETRVVRLNYYIKTNKVVLTFCEYQNLRSLPHIISFFYFVAPDCHLFLFVLMFDTVDVRRFLL